MILKKKKIIIIIIKRKQSWLMSEQSLILNFCLHKCRHMGGRPWVLYTKLYTLLKVVLDQEVFIISIQNKLFKAHSININNTNIKIHLVIIY